MQIVHFHIFQIRFPHFDYKKKKGKKRKELLSLREALMTVVITMKRKSDVNSTNNDVMTNAKLK